MMDYYKKKITIGYFSLICTYKVWKMKANIVRAIYLNIIYFKTTCDLNLFYTFRGKKIKSTFDATYHIKI